MFHYFPSFCNFDPDDWPYYESANQKFAEAAIAHTDEDDIIWVQDYQLLLVPGMIREKAPDRHIGFFCHIPFPDFELFRIIPKRHELLKGMLGSDLIGFHIDSYVDHFLECVRRLMGSMVTVDKDQKTVEYEGRTIRVGAFPISVDTAQIDAIAHSPQCAEKAKALANAYKAGTEVTTIGIGVDRLDYTKGIPERLKALATFFEKYPEYRKKVIFVQIAAPTRVKVREYQELKEDIERLVGEINGRFSEGSWSPIQYINRGLPHETVIPYYQIADFALITPLRDGMNLVAKEYCVAQPDNRGALILSELTGSADEMKEAFLVNPYHPEEVADMLYAVLQIPQAAKEAAMGTLRDIIADQDIHRWVSHYLEALTHAIQHR